MPKLTSKQEAFARSVASGNNQSDAYREAYDARKMKASSVNVNASKLMADAKIAQRVAELRKPAADAAILTLEGHLRRLDQLAELAASHRQYAAAVSAEVARGKAAGVHVERTEQAVTVEFDHGAREALHGKLFR
jgi:phage terminase small subunit